MERILQYSDLSLAFDGKILVENFNLSVNKGDKILLTGRSGSGKTSLLKATLGFAKIYQGKICYKDEVLVDGLFKKIRRESAWVTQQFDHEPEKVRDYLIRLQKFKNCTLKFENKNLLAKKAMEWLEFKESLVDKRTDELSGGEKQRLQLILAWMQEAEIYFLDECTSALDRDLKKKVVNYFLGCSQTIIAISHDEIWKESGAFRELRWPDVS